LTDRDVDPFFADFILASCPMNRYDFERHPIMTEAVLGSMIRCAMWADGWLRRWADVGNPAGRLMKGFMIERHDD
jgi:hypothetical protein